MVDNYYKRKDYHYLVINYEGNILVKVSEGEITFPCITTTGSKNSTSNKVISFRRFLGDTSVLGCSFKMKEGTIFKKRHCGVQRIYYYNNVSANARVNIPDGYTLVPIPELLVNKPNILESNAKAILKKLDHEYLWSVRMLDKPKKLKRLRYSELEVYGE